MATTGAHDDATEMTTESGPGIADNPLVARPLGWAGGVRQFWLDVRQEMKKVSWPARPEVVNTTVIVVIAVFFFALYLFLADILFTYAIEGLEWGARKLFG